MSTDSEIEGGGAPNDVPSDSRAELQHSLERLREFLVIAMDDLAEKVLGQIQTTRGMVDATDSLLVRTRQLAPLARPPDIGEARLRRMAVELDEALREVPDWMQNGYVHTCRELARSLRAVPARADESETRSGSS